LIFRIDRRSVDPKDRSRVIPLEVSLAYMDSAAYKSTYGDKKIWSQFYESFYSPSFTDKT
jgi:small subunit ribosomal protein S18b